MQTNLIFLHGRHTPHCDAHVDKHFDNYYTLQFMASGSVYLAYNDADYNLTGPWFWPAFPGPRIQFYPAFGHTHWEHRYIAFTGSRTIRWIADGLLMSEPQPAPSALNSSAVFDALLAQTEKTDRWSTARAANLLENLLIDLAEARAQPPVAQSWLTPLLDRLANDFVFVPDYTAIAAEYGLALSTLRQQFKAAIGTSLHTYVIQCRMTQARTLLGDTDLPIKTIATRLGYDDVYFFTRQFHQHVGVPPAMFRKSRQV